MEEINKSTKQSKFLSSGATKNVYGKQTSGLPDFRSENFLCVAVSRNISGLYQINRLTWIIPFSTHIFMENIVLRKYITITLY